jgi:hypothetical protein
MTKKIIKILSILVIVGIVLLVVIQLIPYGKNHTNPPVVSSPNWDSQQTQQLAKRACFDCHSNETVWSWYSNIAPISWLVYHDVDEGRSRMNFSNWSSAWSIETGELAEVINEGEMPPAQYLLMHPSATLTATEKEQLITGLMNILNR